MQALSRREPDAALLPQDRGVSLPIDWSPNLATYPPFCSHLLYHLGFLEMGLITMVSGRIPPIVHCPTIYPTLEKIPWSVTLRKRPKNQNRGTYFPSVIWSLGFRRLRGNYLRLKA